MSPGGHASAFYIRETLDEAVRRLSVNSHPIEQRVRASGILILDRLSPADFASTEDRELFDQIRQAFADACFPHEGDSSSGVTDRMCDATAEQIASDILDLRDTMIGRAIRHARMTTHAKARGRGAGVGTQRRLLAYAAAGGAGGGAGDEATAPSAKRASAASDGAKKYSPAVTLTTSGPRAKVWTLAPW